MSQRRMSTFERLNSGQMNRAQRRELGRRVAASDPGLAIVHPHAGGIDVGNESHLVAVPPDRDANPVREFGCWTAALQELAKWLQLCRIDTVAMQATGVYWIALYDILEQHGIRVVLVNAQHTKNVPGRKTDVQESQWLMKLHTYGLLRDSFRLQPEMESVRTISRVRDRHVMPLFSEVGRDLSSRWRTAAHFASWTGLCPDHDSSGGRVLWKGTRKAQNRAGQIFRMAACSLHRSPSPLGNYLRRMKSKLGPKAATTATAHKIAVIFYSMVTKQVEYDESIWVARDAQRQKRLEDKIKRQARQLGYQLVPIEEKPAA
jgi:transposase